MKFKGFVASLLTAILIVNTIGIILMVQEEKKQTKIALDQYDITSFTMLDILNDDTYDSITRNDKIFNELEKRYAYKFSDTIID